MQEVEELSGRIGRTLDRVRGGNEPAVDVRAIQKRSIMIMQQFYKLLLSDFSPTEWKESKAYLRSMGISPLRDMLHVKPAKLPERLRKGLDRYDGPADRKKQLAASLERLEEAVTDLDEAIFASAKLPKKAERAIERLEEIDESLETALSLMRKNEALRLEQERVRRSLPAPEGTMDMDREATEAHAAEISAKGSELEASKSMLAAAEEELATRKERFKNFLASSGRHLNLLITLLPTIREITGPYVKFDSEELTAWEVSVAIDNFAKFRGRMQDGHPLMKFDSDDVVEALRILMSDPEAIGDYNAIRHLQELARERESEVERREEELKLVSGASRLRAIREEIGRRASERRREFERLKGQLENGEDELSDILSGVGVEGGTGMDALRAEVDQLLSLLQ